MATILDVAKDAGVGQGTVSNYLNGKGNVSVEKIKRIKQSIKKLGYIHNRTAGSLRSGHARNFTLILPNLYLNEYAELYQSFELAAKANNYSVNVLYSNNTPEEELSLLRKFSDKESAGLAVLSCLSANAEIPKDIEIMKSNLLYLINRPNTNFPQISFEIKNIALAFAEKINQKNSPCYLVTNRNLNSFEIKFQDNFTKALKNEISLEKIILGDEDFEKKATLFSFLSDIEVPSSLVLLDIQLIDTIITIKKELHLNQLELFHLSGNKLILGEESDRFELNFYDLGQIAVNTLIKNSNILIDNTIETNKNISHDNKIENVLTEIKEVPSTGFIMHLSHSEESREKKIHLATINSPHAKLLLKLLPHIRKHSGIDVEMSIFDYEELYSVLRDRNKNRKYDVIRVDLNWLDTFSKDLLCPLEEVDPNITKSLDNFIPAVLSHYAYVGSTLYALPETPSVQMLFYNKRYFESREIKRLYWEQEKRELDIPNNFQEFNSIARFFTQSINAQSPCQYGCTFTNASSGVLTSEFLARLFALEPYLYLPNGKLNIHEELALQALKETKEALTYSAPLDETPWWSDTAKRFSQGDIALSLQYSNYASLMLSGDISSKYIGYTYVPGNNPVLGGGSLGVSRYSKYPQVALDFIRFITSEPLATFLTSMGSVSPNKRTYSNSSILRQFPWLSLTMQSIKNSTGRKRSEFSTHRRIDEDIFVEEIGEIVKKSVFESLPTLDELETIFDNLK